MGFFKSFFQKIKQKREAVPERVESDESSLSRDSCDMHDALQRQRYIRGCLEQIVETENASEKLAVEYNAVTAYLKDMEEIEALPPQEAQELKANATAVEALEKEHRSYISKPGRMSDGKYHQLECMEEELEEGIEKIHAAEDYQGAIRQDLARLDGERHAYQYRRDELHVTMANTKGMAVICATAIAACFALLLVLHFAFELDTQMGYLITAAAAAITITVIDLRHLDARKELKKVESAINRLILLQNRVKIRYVNNTNLLDYYYLKYDVTKGSELEDLWERYKAEKEERESYRQTSVELDFYRRELLKQLGRLPIQDAGIWLHQTEALINPKEMVEIRHGLIVRRQKLRAQMEYNRTLAGKAQQEIKEVAEQYPAYAKEILDMVSAREKVAAGKTG